MDRCPSCDSRYCRTVCYADDITYSYVVGVGYVPVNQAGRYFLAGHPVDWRASRVSDRRTIQVRDFIPREMAEAST